MNSNAEKKQEPLTGAELIGRNIRLMMEYHRTEPEELAKFLAVSESTVWRGLRKPSRWTVDNLDRMAKLWEVTLPELTGEIRLVQAETELVIGADELAALVRQEAARCPAVCPAV